jgi:hypothetical protein
VQKPIKMPVELMINKKTVTCLPHVSLIFKKISPKSFGCTVYLHNKQEVNLLNKNVEKHNVFDNGVERDGN